MKAANSAPPPKPETVDTAGQLESEIQANGWLTTDSDPDIIFSAADGDRYRRALATLGVDLAALSPVSGRA